MKQKINHFRHPELSRSYKQRINYEWSCPWIFTDRKFPQFWPSILMLALLLSTSTLISHESSYNRLAYICILTQPEKDKRSWYTFVKWLANWSGQSRNDSSQDQAEIEAHSCFVFTLQYCSSPQWISKGWAAIGDSIVPEMIIVYLNHFQNFHECDIRLGRNNQGW
jgi:hypothetical protein